MLESRVYHVVQGHDSNWEVLKEGFTRPHFVRPNKAEAVLMARRLAKLSRNARVVVHASDNHIEREFSFSASFV